METKFEVVPIVIGTVVDFIAYKARFRGLVLDINDGICSIGVVGYNYLLKKPVDDCVSVRTNGTFIDFSNPK